MAFFQRRPTMQSEEAAWASVPYNYGSRCRATDRAHCRGHQGPAPNPFNVHAYRAHLYAASLHNTYGRLGRIGAPTLVVHGADDRMIPVANAHLLADGIPGAGCASSRSRATSTRRTSRAWTRRSARSSRRTEPALAVWRGCVIELTSVQFGAELRVADVIRERALERPRGRRDRARGAAAQLCRAARAVEPPGAGAAAAGAGRGARVAYLGRTAPEVVELLFATSKIGAVTVPLNWRLAAPELTAILADAGAPILIADAGYAALAAELAAAVPQSCGSCVVGDGYEEWIASEPPEDPGHRGESGDTVVQMYTSGTTGVPKGVLTTHRNLAAAAETSPHWAFDSEHDQPHAAADVPYRRHRLGVPRALERRDDDPRQRVRSRRRPRPARAPPGDERRLRADDAADDGRRPRRRRARLLGAALDRLRRLADHHAGAEGGAADVPLPAVRRLRAHRDDRRRRPARPGRPRPGGAARASAALRRTAAALGRDARRRPGHRGRASARRGGRGVAARRRTSWPATSTARRRRRRR